MVLASLKTSSIHFLMHLRHFFIRVLSKKRTAFSLPIEKLSRIGLSKIALYDAKNIERCPWPQTPDGQYARHFLTPLIKQGVQRYIENINTDLRVLLLDDLALPVTINTEEYNNSYVCSPYSYFISYARKSLNFISPVWVRRSIDFLLKGLGKLLKTLQVNKTVIVNNWLSSTNLYPTLHAGHIEAIVKFLKEAFPGHALLFRSLDPRTNKECFEILQEKGFDCIAAREIYFLDPRDFTSLLESRLFKSDLKLLKNCGYEVVDGAKLTSAEIPRLLELYSDLYIEKYSQLNPKINSEFLQLVLKYNLFHLKALKKEGRIDGVIGYVERSGKMYCPFFGYDRQLPQEAGLYRLLCTLLTLEAFEKRLFFHQSSGASMYKKIRKAGNCTDYTAVLCNHLPMYRRIPWILLKCIYNTAGKRFMKNY